MARMGGGRTLKRHAAPAWWPILRKQTTWVIKPSPGPHSLETSIPLLLVLRDLMGLVRNRHEAKVVLNQSKILVNGKVIRRPDFPIGVMDVISIPDMGSHFRMLPFRGSLVPHRIPESELFRILRIENKTCVKGLKLQLNLSGGANLLLDLKSPTDAKNVPFKTLDSLKMDLRARQILEHLQLKVGSYALVVRGKNSGAHGTIQEIVPAFKRRKSLVKIKSVDGNTIETILDYIYVIGNEKPVISLVGEDVGHV